MQWVTSAGNLAEHYAQRTVCMLMLWKARGTARRRLYVAGVTAATALGGVLAAPSHALTSIDHGAWSGGYAFHTCSGSTTSYKCSHFVDSRQSAVNDSGVSVCVESNPAIGRPLSTACYATTVATLPTKTLGYGAPGACVTQTQGAYTGTIFVHSDVLNKNYYVPVDILNNQHGTKVTGSLNSSDGTTIQVVAHWTHGCGDARFNPTSAAGVWSGTFDILV